MLSSRPLFHLLKISLVRQSTNCRVMRLCKIAHIRPDWPKLGPSLHIAISLIVAIRTAKWAASAGKTTSGRVLARLMRANQVMFPQKREPWYKPDGKDQPK
jgi:hypothetical protein